MPKLLNSNVNFLLISNHIRFFEEILQKKFMSKCDNLFLYIPYTRTGWPDALCASIISSHIATISSMERTAAVWGSTIAA